MFDDNDNFNINELTNAVSELPSRAANAVRNRVPSSTPLGMALHAEGKLEALMATLRPEQMEIMAERIIEANKAVGESMLHTPHMESFWKILTVAGDNAEDSHQFYTTLQTLTPTIPGSTYEGEPVSNHQLYTREPDAKFSVMAQAREALEDQTLSDEDRQYWIDQIKLYQPELRDRDDIQPNDVLLDNQEVEAFMSAEGYNQMLGKGAGQVLQSLGFDSRSGISNESGMITLEDAQDFVDNYEESDGDRMLNGGNS